MAAPLHPGSLAYLSQVRPAVILHLHLNIDRHFSVMKKEAEEEEKEEKEEQQRGGRLLVYGALAVLVYRVVFFSVTKQCLMWI